MKLQYFFLSMALAGMSLSACTDLDTSLGGGIITSNTKDSVLSKFPEKAEASVNAIFAQFSQYFPATGDRHDCDYGYASLMLMMDCNGDDMGCDPGSGYQWYAPSLQLADRLYTSSRSTIMWNTLYKQIVPANNIIRTIDPNTQESSSKVYLANALGARAFNYWVLAQLYQYNYKGNEDKACVPLLTDKNMDEAAQNGAKRATVQEVYTQIMSDLDTAIKLLSEENENYGGNTNTLFGAKDNRYINLGVAYGLRARVNLTMHNYKEAAEDANNAIKAEEALGMTKTNLHPGKTIGYDVSDWMWGIKISETDDVVQTGIINWPSHFCTFYKGGYANYSGGFQINKKLYESIPASDIRKGWWLNEEGKSANLTADQQAWASQVAGAYTNVKFGGYQDGAPSKVAANSIPLMRIEEMYLIKAEGLAMSGHEAEGKTVLEQFVKSERDPEYTCTATSATDLQNEILRQRRIELWGEGLSWFDIMRLNKGIDRRGSGFAETVIYDIKPTDPNMLWRIPQAEIQANPQLSDADNNPGGATPVAVPDNSTTKSAHVKKASFKAPMGGRLLRVK